MDATEFDTMQDARRDLFASAALTGLMASGARDLDLASRIAADIAERVLEQMDLRAARRRAQALIDQKK